MYGQRSFLAAAILIILFVLLSFKVKQSANAAASTAIATENVGCDTADLIAKYAALKPTGDQMKDYEAIRNLHIEERKFYTACITHLKWNIEDDVKSEAWDAWVPTGKYIVTAKTKRSVTIDAIHYGDVSDCENHYELVKIVSFGDEKQSETVFNSGGKSDEGCLFQLIVTNLSGPFTLEFEKVK